MLPINFHKTFVPERRLITALLEFAALGKEGTLQEISEDTNIPMGKSTGKMPAILDYCLGMGLVFLRPGSQKQFKKPVLTSFGEAVFLNDKYLGEPLTQWLAHFYLCRSDIGAKAWHCVFAKGRNILGTNFTAEQLEQYLVSHLGSGNNRTGPLLLTYMEEAAFGRARVLRVEKAKIERHKAPILSSWANAYSALILELLASFFPDQNQVTISDFAQETHLFDVYLWQDTEITSLLSMIEKSGYIAIDRQIRPWVLEKKTRPQVIWPHIYDDIA